MLVFYKERLAFLSMPKTGTTAYHRALAARADMMISDPPALKHASVHRYGRFIRPMFEKTSNAELELLAVMREPVSWLGSWFRYRQRPFLKGKPNSTLGLSFDDFVEAYLMGQRPPFADVGSQAQFLRPHPNGTSVRHLFRYEDQARLNTFLEHRLGETLVLTRENVSPTADLRLSPDIAAKLRRKCAEDFDVYTAIP